MTDWTDAEAYIALNMVEGIGPVKVRALIDALGSPREVFTAPSSRLLDIPGIGRQLASTLAHAAERINPRTELKNAHKLGARILTPLDSEYPELLKTIHDPPLALYVVGSLESKDRHGVALVGSRRCTAYGRETAHRLAYDLGKAGCCVISGLARGIDTSAHEGALESGGRTIAVLGGALDCLYPPENKDLARRIAHQGAVLSEYPLGRQPDRQTFPYRNRIVSGLSLGTVVVEAPKKSGAMITVEAAIQQGRQVFAVPGRIDVRSSGGPNSLIRDGAKLVEDVNDILREFEYLISFDSAECSRETVSGGAPVLTWSDEETCLLGILADEREVFVDNLIRQSGLEPARVSSLLLQLEMKKAVRMLPGRMVALTVQG